MCFGNSGKKGFYYVRYYNSTQDCGTGGFVSTAYAYPALIVQKDKLRPDQIEYMERASVRKSGNSKIKESNGEKDKEI